MPARVRYGIRASASSGAGGTQCMGCMYVDRGASLLPAACISGEGAECAKENTSTRGCTRVLRRCTRVWRTIAADARCEDQRAAVWVTMTEDVRKLSRRQMW